MLDKLTGPELFWLAIIAMVTLLLVVAMVVPRPRPRVAADEGADEALDHLEKLSLVQQDTYALLELMAADLARAAAALERIDAHFATAGREIAGIRMRDVGSTDPELIESMRSIIREGGQP